MRTPNSTIAMQLEPTLWDSHLAQAKVPDQSFWCLENLENLLFSTFSYMHREPLESGIDRGEHVRKRQEPRSLLCWPCVTGGSCRLGCDEPYPVGTVQKELDKSGLSLGQGTHAVHSLSIPVAASPSSDPRRPAADTIPFIFGISRSRNWPRPTAWHRQSRPVPLAGCTCG